MPADVAGIDLTDLDRFTAGFQFFGTNQNDAQFQNINGNRGAQIKNQVNITNTFGVYAENQHDVVPAVSLVTGGRLQVTDDQVRDRFLADGNQSDSTSFFGASPKVGFVWRAAPTVQIFGNAQNPFQAAQDRAWGAALTLVAIVFLLTVAARVVSARITRRHST